MCTKHIPPTSKGLKKTDFHGQGIQHPQNLATFVLSIIIKTTSMKKIFYILSLFAVCACTNTPGKGSADNADNESSYTESNEEGLPTCKEYMEELAKGFAEAVEKHDLQKAMTYLSPRYVKEQHDDFLGGRTEQFISELLGGTLPDGSFSCPRISEIVSVEVLNADCPEEGDPFAYFQIKLKGGEIIYVTLETQDENTKNGYLPLWEV